MIESPVKPVDPLAAKLDELPQSKRVPLRCGHPGCKSPYAHAQNGVIIVVSEHHGCRHENVITVSDLLALCVETAKA